MKMIKTVLAVALAAATLGMSTGAMALTFTDGDFNGGVDIGGDINVPVATNYWQWAAGDVQTFSHVVTQMDATYKILTIPAASNIPLLVGQTKQASIGGVGLTPNITLQDAKGNALVPVWGTTGNTSKGTLTLPVTAADGTTALGNMMLTVKAAGVAGITNLAGIGSAVSIRAQYFTASNGLFGSSAIPGSAAGTFTTGSAALAWANALGVTKTKANLLTDLNTASGLSLSAFNDDNVISYSGMADPGYYWTGAYGLGIAQGDNVVINFTNPVTTTTNWKTQLKMTVTYI